LYRLRHGAGRIGKVRGGVFEAVLECGGGVSRAELAGRLGAKPNTLGKHLRKLVDRNLLERRSRGRYWPAENWERALDKQRLKHGELEAEDKDRRRYEEDRKQHRERLAQKREAAEARAASDQPRETHEPKPEVSETTEERVARLVRQGMSRRWAEAEVLGTGEEEL